jgi:hypothetical protein
MVGKRKADYSRKALDGDALTPTLSLRERGRGRSGNTKHSLSLGERGG